MILYMEDDFEFAWLDNPHGPSSLSAACRHCGERGYCSIPLGNSMTNRRGKAMSVVPHASSCALVRAANRAAESKQ